MSRIEDKERRGGNGPKQSSRDVQYREEEGEPQTLVCSAQDDDDDGAGTRRWMSYKADTLFYFTLLLRLLSENL